MPEKMRLLPVVKAYPVLEPGTGQEAVCIAAITLDEPHRWVRLFPMDYRALPAAERFKKYEPIELDVTKGDSRPESFTPVLNSIRTIGPTIDTDRGTWRRRLPYFDPLMEESMCAIRRRQAQDRTSFGIFRPAEILDLTVGPQEAGFAERQLAILRQPSLTGDRAGDASRIPLEPLPVKAKFRYRCSDPGCKNGHEQSFIDWELGQFARNAIKDSATGDELYTSVKRKFFDEICGPDRDTRFIVGNTLRYPTTFLILGLVYPKRPKPTVPAPPSLF